MVIRYLEDGKIEVLGKIFETLAERHNTNENWQDEKEWFQTLRSTLEERATSHSRLARAQLNQFFDWHWKI